MRNPRWENRRIRSIRGQFRTFRDNLENAYEVLIDSGHPVIPWMVDHSAATIDRFQVGGDGKTSYERRRGKTFQKELAEFSECVWYLKAKSKSTPDIQSRWATGVWLGVREESNEIIVGTSEGAIKTRTIRRKADPKDSWNADELSAMKGTP